jgi:hypothetical protein
MPVTFQEYPKYMTHKGHQPAVWKKDNKGFVSDVDALVSPEKYPDIIVTSAEHESRMAKEGYSAIVSPSKANYDKAIMENTMPDGYSYKEYPKWKYNKDSPAVIVNSKIEELALKGTWSDTPISK